MATDGRQISFNGSSFSIDGRQVATDGRSLAPYGRRFSVDGRSLATDGRPLAGYITSSDALLSLTEAYFI